VKRVGLLLLVAILLGACGGSSPTASACRGLPTAKHTAPPLTLFGAVDRLGKRVLCAEFGVPSRIAQLAGGRENWKYGDVTFILRQGRVVSYHQPASLTSSPTTYPTRAKTFDVCASRSPVVTVSRHRAATGLELIADRKRGAIVAEFGFLPSVQAAKAVSNSPEFRSPRFGYRAGRYVLLTTPAVQDHDLAAIENCSEQAFDAQ